VKQIFAILIMLVLICNISLAASPEVERKNLISNGAKEINGYDISIEEVDFEHKGEMVKNVHRIQTRFQYKFLGFMPVTAEISEYALEDGVLLERDRNFFAWSYEFFKGKASE